jgi:hypothetical protein
MNATIIIFTPVSRTINDVETAYSCFSDIHAENVTVITTVINALFAKQTSNQENFYDTGQLVLLFSDLAAISQHVAGFTGTCRINAVIS